MVRCLMSKETTIKNWSTRVIPGLCYLIAIFLTLSGPILVAGSLGLALFAGDPTLAGLGILAGAVLGASGAIALLWCLARPAGWKSAG